MRVQLILFTDGDAQLSQDFQQTMFSGKPDNLDGILECVVGGAYCELNPSDFGIYQLPGMAIVGLTNNETYALHSRYYGPWTTQQLQNKVLSLAPSPAPIDQSSGAGGNAPGDQWGDDPGGGFGIPGGGLGLGLDLPGWMWWAIAAGNAYALSRSKNQTGKILYGGGLALSVLNATKGGAPAAVGDIDPSRIGKATDGLPIKRGSRVDQYWRGKIHINKKWFGGRDPIGDARLTVQDVTNRFNLHSIEFGNWVTESERVNALVAIDQSLRDLALVMNVPQKKVGFNQKLAIAFGARGRGSAKATYHPSIHLINLTKTKGANSLAHEYGHAVDFFLGKGRSLTNKRDRSASGAPGKFANVFHKVYHNDNGSKNAFYNRLQELPKYWKSSVEVWARSFESWVQYRLNKKGLKNTFLAKSSYSSPVYPDKKHVELIDKEIAQIIGLLFR